VGANLLDLEQHIVERCDIAPARNFLFPIALALTPNLIGISPDIETFLDQAIANQGREPQRPDQEPVRRIR
jgi:hypothetical protein